MPRNRRRIFTAIGIAIACLVVCGILLERQIKSRRQFHEKLSSIDVWYEPPLLHTWLSWIGSRTNSATSKWIEQLGRPAQLHAGHWTPILDEDLRAAVDYSKGWQGFYFHRSSLTNHQLELLQPCDQVDCICVSCSELDQGAIPTLALFTSVKYLQVEELPFGDSEIATLAELPNLRNLFTRCCPITRQVVPALARSRTLRKWYTSDCPQLVLTPADFLKLRHLEVVYLSESSVTDLEESRALIADSGGQLRIIIDEPQPEIEIPEGSDSKDLGF